MILHFKKPLRLSIKIYDGIIFLEILCFFVSYKFYLILLIFIQTKMMYGTYF